MSVAQNLSSLGVQAGNNMISILNRKIIIRKEDAVLLTGWRASNGLWKVPIVHKSTPRINFNACYHPAIANNVVPTYKDKPLWNIPLSTATWSPHEQPHIYCALSAYTQPTLEALAIYFHSCAGWPVTETWCNTIRKGKLLVLATSVKINRSSMDSKTSTKVKEDYHKPYESNTIKHTTTTRSTIKKMNRKVQKMKMMDPSLYWHHLVHNYN